MGVVEVTTDSLVSTQQGVQVATSHPTRKLPKFLLFIQKIFPIEFFLSRGFSYPIEDWITSQATMVIFNYRDHLNQQICLKIWRECDNGVYHTKDLTRCTYYLLEGLEFNRCFAQDVYLGIAQVLDESRNEIRCGRLIKFPNSETLLPDKKYALVMRRLDQSWRLDHQLDACNLGNFEGMRFLAEQIARMHALLDKSPNGMGSHERIESKLDFNRNHFQNALDQLAEEGIDVQNFRFIGIVMEQASKAHLRHFQKRYENNHIKRCHGDLKTTNLWVSPEVTHSDNPTKSKRQLLALDCVDFNPEFSNIDTLSDIAMLAIDLEVRLTTSLCKDGNRTSVEEFTYHFLTTYLQEAGESKEVCPILEYYMTEKSMVCAYMSISFDGLSTLGMEYLNVALVHAQKLASSL